MARAFSLSVHYGCSIISACENASLNPRPKSPMQIRRLCTAAGDTVVLAQTNTAASMRCNSSSVSELSRAVILRINNAPLSLLCRSFCLASRCGFFSAKESLVVAAFLLPTRTIPWLLLLFHLGRGWLGQIYALIQHSLCSRDRAVVWLL